MRFLVFLVVVYSVLPAWSSSVFLDHPSFPRAEDRPSSPAFLSRLALEQRAAHFLTSGLGWLPYMSRAVLMTRADHDESAHRPPTPVELLQVLLKSPPDELAKQEQRLVEVMVSELHTCVKFCKLFPRGERDISSLVAQGIEAVREQFSARSAASASGSEAPVDTTSGFFGNDPDSSSVAASSLDFCVHEKDESNKEEVVRAWVSDNGKTAQGLVWRTKDVSCFQDNRVNVGFAGGHLYWHRKFLPSMEGQGPSMFLPEPLGDSQDAFLFFPPGSPNTYENRFFTFFHAALGYLDVTLGHPRQDQSGEAAPRFAFEDVLSQYSGGGRLFLLGHSQGSADAVIWHWILTASEEEFHCVLKTELVRLIHNEIAKLKKRAEPKQIWINKELRTLFPEGTGKVEPHVLEEKRIELVQNWQVKYSTSSGALEDIRQVSYFQEDLKSIDTRAKDLPLRRFRDKMREKFEAENVYAFPTAGLAMNPTSPALPEYDSDAPGDHSKADSCDIKIPADWTDYIRKEHKRITFFVAEEEGSPVLDVYEITPWWRKAVAEKEIFNIVRLSLNSVGGNFQRSEEPAWDGSSVNWTIQLDPKVEEIHQFKTGYKARLKALLKYHV